MIALFVILIMFGAPAKCVALPSDLADVQVFVDADRNAATGYGWGSEYVVRCVAAELADAWHCQVREATKLLSHEVTEGEECGAAGGWGPAIDVAEISATTLAMPESLLPAGARLVLETYTAHGVRLTSGPVNAVNCQAACGLGDFDGDCDVDLADYAIFQNSFGQ